jgi:hypothetical protein
MKNYSTKFRWATILSIVDLVEAEFSRANVAAAAVKRSIFICAVDTADVFWTKINLHGRCMIAWPPRSSEHEREGGKICDENTPVCGSLRRPSGKK